MIGSAIDQQGAVSSTTSTEMNTPLEGATGEMASGAASAQNVSYLILISFNNIEIFTIAQCVCY